MLTNIVNKACHYVYDNYQIIYNYRFCLYGTQNDRNIKNTCEYIVYIITIIVREQKNNLSSI